MFGGHFFREPVNIVEDNRVEVEDISKAVNLDVLGPLLIQSVIPLLGPSAMSGSSSRRFEECVCHTLALQSQSSCS